MTKELTAENKFEMISLLVNGFVNTKETKTVTQEVSNLQHFMIDNIIKKVHLTENLDDLLTVMDSVCRMLEQPFYKNVASEYRTVFENNYLIIGSTPDDAKIRFIESQNDLYCNIKKIKDEEKWRIAQCVRVLIRLVNYYELENVEGE